jgi:hypothetical protein
MAFPGLVWYVCVTILGGKRKWGDLAYTRARCLPTPFATREAPHVVLPLCRKPMERIPRRRPIARRRGRVRAFPSEAISSTERPESLCRRAPPTSIASQLVALWTLRHAKFLSIGACKNPRVIDCTANAADRGVWVPASPSSTCVYVWQVPTDFGAWPEV